MNDLDALNAGSPTHAPNPTAPDMVVVDGHKVDRDTLRCRLCGMTWSDIVKDPKNCGGNDAK